MSTSVYIKCNVCGWEGSKEVSKCPNCGSNDLCIIWTDEREPEPEMEMKNRGNDNEANTFYI